MELSEQNNQDIYQECRICLEEDTVENLISPCECKGTHRYVHGDCLSEWRKRFSRMHVHRHYCSVCKRQFQTPVSGYVTIMETTPEHRIEIFPPDSPIPPPIEHRRRPFVRRTWPNVFFHVIVQCCSGVILFGYFMMILTTNHPPSKFWVVHNVGNPFTIDNVWILVHFGSVVVQTCCFASLTSEPVHLLTLSGLSVYFIFFTPFMAVIFHVLLLITNWATY